MWSDFYTCSIAQCPSLPQAWQYAPEESLVPELIIKTWPHMNGLSSI